MPGTFFQQRLLALIKQEHRQLGIENPLNVLLCGSNSWIVATRWLKGNDLLFHSFKWIRFVRNTISQSYAFFINRMKWFHRKTLNWIWVYCSIFVLLWYLKIVLLYFCLFDLFCVFWTFSLYFFNCLPRLVIYSNSVLVNWNAMFVTIEIECVSFCVMTKVCFIYIFCKFRSYS